MIITTGIFALVLGYTYSPSPELLTAIVMANALLVFAFYFFQFRITAGLMWAQIDGDADGKYLIISRLISIASFVIMYNSSDSLANAMAYMMVPYLFVNILCDITVLFVKMGVIEIRKKE